MGQRQGETAMELRGEWVVALLAICAAVVSLTGCEICWQAYQQIEIGKPLPTEHLLLRKGIAAKPGRGWGRYSVCPLLASYSAEVVSVLVDGPEKDFGLTGPAAYDLANRLRRRIARAPIASSDSVIGSGITMISMTEPSLRYVVSVSVSGVVSMMPKHFVCSE